MKSYRTSFYLLVVILIAIGALLTWHRHVTFNVPWLPDQDRQIWSVEARIDFSAFGDPVKADFAVPDTQPGFDLVGEHTASPGYGLSFNGSGAGRRAVWSIREATGDQTLYYQVDMLVNPETVDERTGQPPVLDPQVHTGPHATAADQLLRNARQRSADNYTLTRELIEEFNTQEQSAQLLEQVKPRTDWLVDLLHHAGAPARTVLILSLEDGRRRQPLQPYLQVFQGNEYRLFDPASGRQGRRPNQLLWEYASGSSLDLIGGRNSSVSFSVIAQEVPVGQMLQEGQMTRPGVLDFSINSLPVAEQALFKGILSIPVGVLVVSLMRILVGIRTSGTFMPVLIARISAVIISVIILIAIFTVLSFELGLSEGLKITFFPMIILSWTIERMSILWEEEGPREVLIQGGGSLLVALLAYMVMNAQWVRHLTFNFLGLQLVFMAVILLLGNYTGYRLLELRRFRPLVERGGVV